MGSIAAAEVAEEVLATIGRRKRPIIEKIVVSKGYSPNTARAGLVQKTKSYQAVVRPYAKRLQRHQEKILKAMENKDLNEEQYRVLTDSLSKVTHDVQLLTGGATENLQVKPIMDVQQNNIDKEDNQS